MNTNTLPKVTTSEVTVSKITIEPIAVLDHGYVRLVDYMGTDQSIIEAARMSTGKGFLGWDKDEGLLDYLFSNSHSTPFEMCEIAVEVHAPIFVFRQWHRHRTQSVNEFSSRYSELPDVFYLPTWERCAERQGTTNKQGSVFSVLADEATAKSETLSIQAETIESYSHYRRRLGQGIPKELARLNMPVSGYSKMRAKANLHNWLHFLGLRMDSHAQMEIRVFADAVGAVVSALYPRTFELFLEYRLHAARFSRAELGVLQALMQNLLEGNVQLVSLPQYLKQAAGGLGGVRKSDAFLAKLGVRKSVDLSIGGGA